MKKSIMPKDDMWSTKHFEGSHKHHIFGGANRKRSERDGLFIYLTPEMHNMSDRGIHFNPTFMEYAHTVGQQVWMQYYNKTKEEFIKEYGKVTSRADTTICPLIIRKEKANGQKQLSNLLRL